MKKLSELLRRWNLVFGASVGVSVGCHLAPSELAHVVGGSPKGSWGQLSSAAESPKGSW